MQNVLGFETREGQVVGMASYLSRRAVSHRSAAFVTSVSGDERTLARIPPITPIEPAKRIDERAALKHSPYIDREP